MDFQIREAKRERIWTKTALMAPSGGGKTYSALRMATGMLSKLKEIGEEKNGKILMANTEASRGKYYANEFKYDIVDMTAPHNPENYVELIDYAVEKNYAVLILDSTSHEWEGKGGCLDLQQQAGGTYQAWAKVTPRHDKFIQAIADSPIHIIATMRGKDQYSMEVAETGRTTVKKLGIGAKQREGFEYEFTCTFLIDQKSNMSTPQKDNTHLFENEGDVKLSEAYGKRIIEWASSGEGYTVPVRNRTTDVELTKEAKKSAIDVLKALGGSKDAEAMAIVAKYTETSNPNKMTDVGELEEMTKELENLQASREGKAK